jgi:hypothetical protein
MWLVAVPSDTDTDIVFGAENLPNSGSWTSEDFGLLDCLGQPGGDGVGLL